MPKIFKNDQIFQSPPESAEISWNTGFDFFGVLYLQIHYPIMGFSYSQLQQCFFFIWDTYTCIIIFHRCSLILILQNFYLFHLVGRYRYIWISFPKFLRMKEISLIKVTEGVSTFLILSQNVGSFNDHFTLLCP